ncbi:hypothetical protein AAG570_001147 [Ranatra chinensis]|uniref:Uncharacterized protein n=1 Tax=Ranatra chinensis TaxID=642074 RepID=A0ABD0YBA1_9HEMI
MASKGRNMFYKNGNRSAGLQVLQLKLPPTPPPRHLFQLGRSKLWVKQRSALPNKAPGLLYQLHNITPIGVFLYPRNEKHLALGTISLVYTRRYAIADDGGSRDETLGKRLNLTGAGRVDMSCFDLLKVLGTGAVEQIMRSSTSPRPTTSSVAKVFGQTPSSARDDGLRGLQLGWRLLVRFGDENQPEESERNLAEW